MEQHLTMVYWKGDQFWLGKLIEHPEIMSQGETIEELEANLKDAYIALIMDDVPKHCEARSMIGTRLFPIPVTLYEMMTGHLPFRGSTRRC